MAGAHAAGADCGRGGDPDDNPRFAACSTGISSSFSDYSKSIAAVEYLIVGGYAVGVHGFPRYTGDLDVFVATSRSNAEALLDVFAEFGFASLNLKPDDFLEPDTIVEIGREPIKIQVLTGIDGVTFDRGRQDRVSVEMAGLSVPFIGFDSLVANKAAAPRAKDKIDLEELRRIRDEKSREGDEDDRGSPP